VMMFGLRVCSEELAEDIDLMLGVSKIVGDV
jgi:hypothetical protein